MMKEKIEALKELSKPLVDYLRENYDPYCEVVISATHIRLVRDEIGISVKGNDD